MAVVTSTKQPRFTVSTRTQRRIVYYAFSLILAFLFLFPIAWSILTSLKPTIEASASPPTFLPSYISLDNYAKLNTFGQGIWRHVGNSAFVAILTVIGSIILCTMGGYGFSRFHFRGKNALFVLILTTLMIPFQSILTPLFIVLRTLGLQNTLWGLALVYITFQLPFGIFLMRNSFDSVPREIEEAALLDGCSSMTLLYRVMLNIVRPGIITIGLFAFFNAWNEFIAALIFMTNSDNFTLPILLLSVQSGQWGTIDWGALQAGITIAMLPCLLLFLALQRHYINGLTSGAMK
ncbi:MAG: carbohydrate ABC transporter permease [Anaerolineae bacterium]|nr:carbohydrate ABC transporter permease [Anaerolineae bacterium]